MDKELLACIDDNDIKFLQSGQISKYIFPLERNQAHKNKVSHIIVRLFILAITPDNKILYLVQKRGKNKDGYPNHYTDSASGHVLYHKNLNLTLIKKNAIRELEEEFGISSKAVKKLIFYDLNVEEDNFTTEIAYIFFGLVEYNVKLEPDPEELEIEGSRFYTRKELINLLKNEKSVDYSKKVWEYLLKTNIKSLFTNEKTTTESKDIPLYIGRFQPLHHGHIYVIYRILEKHNKIKIGIGSSQFSNIQNNPFSADERKKFIIAALKKRNITNYEIFEIPDIFNAKKWVEHVESIVGHFDVVYSNSEWVRQLFQNKNYSLGKKLTIFKNKYNASHIRDLIMRKNKIWRNLVPNEVISCITEFNGINRIISLQENSDR